MATEDRGMSMDPEKRKKENLGHENMMDDDEKEKNKEINPDQDREKHNGSEININTPPEIDDKEKDDLI